jgi:hypothetical protein
LNEIIVDFDEILDDEKFTAVEKIKTIGNVRAWILITFIYSVVYL